MGVLFSLVSPSSMDGLIQPKIDCMLFWKSHFSKNERSVLIRLPHFETAHGFHYTQREISRVTLMRHLCPLQRPTSTTSWKPSIFSSLYILPLRMSCRSISFAGGIYLCGCLSHPGEQPRGLFDACLVKGLLIDLETESREHNQWSIVYCF